MILDGYGEASVGSIINKHAILQQVATDQSDNTLPLDRDSHCFLGIKLSVPAREQQFYGLSQAFCFNMASRRHFSRAIASQAHLNGSFSIDAGRRSPSVNESNTGNRRRDWLSCCLKCGCEILVGMNYNRNNWTAIEQRSLTVHWNNLPVGLLNLPL